VPEGKGVSSSASVEVATMSAIAAAYGLLIAHSYLYHNPATYLTNLVRIS
jgi:mevalonate kinase